MAPARVLAPPYSTRRKKQVPVCRSSSASPEVVVSTACCPDVRYPGGCGLHSTRDDADDILRDAFLAVKEGDEEEKQDYTTGAKQRVAHFPCSSTMRYTAPTESSTDSTPFPIHMEQPEVIFERLRNTPLLCDRLAAEFTEALETTALDKNTQGSLPGMSLAKSPDTEDTYQREASPKVSHNPRDFAEFFTEEASDQMNETCPNEAPPDETGKYACHPILPSGVQEEVVAERKLSPDLDENPQAKLRTSVDKEMERQLSTTVPDKPPLPEEAGGANGVPPISKKRRGSALSDTPATGEGVGEGLNGKDSQSVVPIQVNAREGDCTESGSSSRTFPDGLPETSSEDANSVCRLVTGKEVACKEEYPIRPSHKPTRQQTPAKPLSVVSPSTVHVDTVATTTAEEIATNQESRTVVQQNTTALIKRRRCGSLGLDQSLRWQAMARRVPRIKGVCYSTTRHEWIAVGPLQAGSARKKNIYFSVPKHGFDGARRLAVECRRRLQAGVPVNVQEFVKEQKLLFQSETKVNEPAEVATSVLDAGPLAEEISSTDNHRSLGSTAPGAPHTLSKKLSASTHGPLAGVSLQAQGSGQPEIPSTSATNGRRRQRPRGLTFGSLQRDMAQELLSGDGGLEEISGKNEKQRGSQMQKALEARDPSQIDFLKAGWHGYSAKDNSRQASAANKHRHPCESDITALAHDEAASGTTLTHTRSLDGSGTPAKSEIDNADASVKADGMEVGPTCRSVTHMFEGGEIMERERSSDASAFNTAARLAIMARRTALQSEESAAALLLTGAFTSESGCRCSTERSLQLWASVLNRPTQVDGQATNHNKRCTEGGITSALSAVLTAANREKICSSTDGCLPNRATVLRSISFSNRTTAKPPRMHLPFQRKECPRRQGQSSKRGLQQQRHDSFLANDYYGRRSSTTSSAGSCSAGVSSLSETNCENPEYSHASKESSDDCDSNKNTIPEKHPLKPWGSESFPGDALLVPQLEDGCRRKTQCVTAGIRRFSAASAVSCASENVDNGGATATTGLISNPSNGRRSLVDLLDPKGTLASEDVTDPRRNHACAVADGSAPGSNTDSSQTVRARELTDTTAKSPAAYSVTEGTRAISKDALEKSPLHSLSLGNGFTSTATLGCPAASNYSGASAFLEQPSGLSDSVVGRISLLQEIERADINCQVLDVVEDAKVTLQDSEAGSSVFSRGSGESALEEASRERESGDEKLTTKQTVSSELSPLVKALCLMLVDLLRFCSCSPVALTRAGMQPSQIAFCKNEGIRVLRTALQDVSATRTVSRTFRAYLEVFEDSILANALPTSGGAAEIMRYLCRLKQLNEGRGCRPGPADNDNPTGGTCPGPKCDSGNLKLEQRQERCTGRDNYGINDHSAVRRTIWPIYKRRKYQRWNEVLATSIHLDEQDATSSQDVQRGELARDNGRASRVEDAAEDVNGLFNSPVTSAVSSWHLTQRHAVEEVEQRRCAAVEKLSGQRTRVSETRGGEAYQESTLSYAHGTQPDNEQTHPERAYSSSSRRANIFANNNIARGVQNLEKRRTNDCPDSPDVAREGSLPVGRATECICEIASSTSKTQTDNEEIMCKEEKFALCYTASTRVERVRRALRSKSPHFELTDACVQWASQRIGTLPCLLTDEKLYCKDGRTLGYVARYGVSARR